MLARGRLVQVDRAQGIAYPPFRQLGSATEGFGPGMPLRDRLRDLQEHGEGRGMVTPLELQPEEPPEHGEIEPPERQRLGAGLHGFVDAPQLLEDQPALGLQRGRARCRRLPRFFQQQVGALARWEARQGEQGMPGRAGGPVDAASLAQERGRAHVVSGGACQLAGLDQQVGRVGSGGRVRPRFQRLRELEEIARLERERAPGLQPPRAHQAARHLGSPARQVDAAAGIALAHHGGSAGQQLGADGARELRRGLLEHARQLGAGADRRQGPREHAQRGAMAGNELQRPPGQRGGFGAICSALVPDRRFQIVTGGFLRRVRLQRLAERHETFRGGVGISLRHQAGMKRDDRRVSGIVRQCLGEQLLLLHRVRKQQGCPHLQVRALARLDASFSALPEQVRQIGRFLLLGEIAAEREQGTVPAVLFQRRRGLGETF